MKVTRFMRLPILWEMLLLITALSLEIVIISGASSKLSLILLG